MKIIHAGYKQFNVNSRGNYTGDCVIRSLSVAYGMDYDEVHSKLGAIKRKKFGNSDSWKFNSYPVFEEFIRQHGCVRSGYAKDLGIAPETTLEQFCESYPEGTYCLIVCDSRNKPNHMVAVVDGDFYDSWYSAENTVYKLYQIKGEKSAPDAELDLDQVQTAIIDFLTEYTEVLKKKMGDYGVFTYGLNRRVNKSSLRFCINFATEMKTYKPTRYYFTVSLNPRISMEDNISKLIAKTRVNVREWAYALRKDIEDRAAIETMETNSKFRGTTDDRMLLLKMPAWARPHITYIEYREGSWYADEPYLMDMDALPGDPRGEEAPTVTFRARTLTELRACLEDYKKDFSRFNYDY